MRSHNTPHSASAAESGETGRRLQLPPGALRCAQLRLLAPEALVG